MSESQESSPLVGNVFNRRRHAWMVAMTGFMGAALIVGFVIHAGSTSRSMVLIQKTKGSAALKAPKAAALTPAQEDEKMMVECVAGFGVLGAALCPSSKTLTKTHTMLKDALEKTDEYVHSLAPVAEPALPSAAAPVAAASAVPVNSQLSHDETKAPEAAAKSAVEPANTKAQAAVAAPEEAAAAPAPVDCACCHSKCQRSGVYKDPKKKAASHSYWCVKKGQVGSPSYCPAQDYNCLCCDHVRNDLKGRSCF
eukprot:CAMPEP_0113701526 /NCGR_PEP_ID=MMETSP0038_2-20120614/24631_1 /TAXON_ID=2898 /ORGANISM="Cryptomonas paramecium" /LENGTH=252 /DNA_ID=CAMNT_0000625443 /DNA_START=21 /DNA_END=779 /DNA_ORIENTATION=- /assembly_acc=CAM_ASM_000170